MTVLVQATIATVLGPLVAELAASRQTNERQAEQLVSQAGTIGRQSERVAGLELENGKLTTELERAASAVVTLRDALEARTAPQTVAPSTGPPRPVWRSWGPWLLTVLALVVVMGMVGWPR